MKTKSNIIIFKSNDGKINIDCIFDSENVWLSQSQIAKLYGRSVSTINEHIKNIFNEEELKENQVSSKFGISEFTTKPTIYYNLELILAVGYRVKSLMGTTFRIWATNNLKEYDLYLQNNLTQVEKDYLDLMRNKIDLIGNSSNENN